MVISHALNFLPGNQLLVGMSGEMKFNQILSYVQSAAEPKAVADGIPVFCAFDELVPITNIFALGDMVAGTGRRVYAPKGRGGAGYE